MGTIAKQYAPVLIPVDGEPPLLPPLAIARDDLTNRDAWDRLNCIPADPYLEVWDFKTTDLFEKYFLASLGLLEYPYAMITGDVGQGKSFFLNLMSYWIAKHYGKKMTINWIAKNPTLFSPFNKWKEGDNWDPYHTLQDSNFVKIAQNEINDMFDKFMELKREPTREEAEKAVLFNSHMSIDEGSGIAVGTNLLQLVSKLKDRRRHLFLGIMMSFVKDTDAKGNLSIENASHVITCSKNLFYHDTCTFKIDHRRGGVCKMLHARPKDYAFLWNTQNWVGVNTAADVKFGNAKAKEDKKRRELLNSMEGADK